MNHLPRPAPGRATACGALFALILLAAAMLPNPATATPVTFMVPAGGEIWTAGTNHTIEWQGGGPTGVFALVMVEVANPNNQVTVSAFFPNNGYVGWTIPTNIPMGAYKPLIGIDQDQAGPYEGPIFTIRPAPECLSGCYQVWANFPGPSPSFTAPPIGQCAASPTQAEAMAQQYILDQLLNQCGEGYNLDPGSVLIDVTLLPVGECLNQEQIGGGLFVAEATGVGCCCADAVPTTRENWGSLKSMYR
jgi:hypothetical protein